jgi:hypothetical protein
MNKEEMLQSVQKETEIFNKRSLSEKVLIVAFFILSILGGIYFFYQRTANESKPVPTLSLEPTKSYTDNKGTTFTQVVTRDLTQKEMNQITDSIRKSIKGHPEIKEVVKYVPYIDTTFKNVPVTQVGDTVTLTKIDDYVYIVSKADLKTKLGTIDLKLKDTVTVVIGVHKRLLRANQDTVTIMHKSPYINIDMGKALIVKEPKVLLSLGPSIVYNPFTQKMQYGLGVTFNLVSIKSKR